MALIKCPECGEQVSSNAPQCVHCGCHFSVCPECGKAYVGEPETCSKCGFKLSTGFRKSDKNYNSGFGNDVMKVWQKRAESDKMVLKLLRYAQYALFAVIVILFIIAWITIDRWDSKSLENLLRIENVRDKAQGLAVGISVLYALIPIVDNAKFIYMQVVCSMWLSKNNIDIVPLVRKANAKINMSDNATEDDFENMSSAAYLSVVVHDRNIKIAKMCVIALFSVASAIALGVFLSKTADSWLVSKVNEYEPFKFEYTPLIVFGALFALNKIICWALDFSFAKRKEAWLNQL